MNPPAENINHLVDKTWITYLNMNHLVEERESSLEKTWITWMKNTNYLLAWRTWVIWWRTWVIWLKTWITWLKNMNHLFERFTNSSGCSTFSFPCVPFSRLSKMFWDFVVFAWFHLDTLKRTHRLWGSITKLRNCQTLEYLKASLSPPAPLTVAGLLVVGLLALQYSDRLDGLLVCWIFAAWSLLC